MPRHLSGHMIQNIVDKSLDVTRTMSLTSVSRTQSERSQPRKQLVIFAKRWLLLVTRKQNVGASRSLNGIPISMHLQEVFSLGHLN